MQKVGMSFLLQEKGTEAEVAAFNAARKLGVPWAERLKCCNKEYVVCDLSLPSSCQSQGHVANQYELEIQDALQIPEHEQEPPPQSQKKKKTDQELRRDEWERLTRVCVRAMHSHCTHIVHHIVRSPISQHPYHHCFVCLGVALGKDPPGRQRRVVPALWQSVPGRVRRKKRC